MDTNNMKNIVVLKDLPSNLIDEAIIFLKQNQKVKKPEYIEDSEKFKDDNNNFKNQNEFLVNEAKNVIESYITKVENECNQTKNNNKGIIKKYKRLRNLNIFLVLMLIISFGFCLI